MLRCSGPCPFLLSLRNLVRERLGWDIMTCSGPPHKLHDSVGIWTSISLFPVRQVLLGVARYKNRQWILWSFMLCHWDFMVWGSNLFYCLNSCCTGNVCLLFCSFHTVVSRRMLPLTFCSRRSPVVCTNGCVASSQPLATNIGLGNWFPLFL